MGKKLKRKVEHNPFYPSMFKSVKKRPRGHGRVCTLDTEAIGLLPDLIEGAPTSGHVIVLRDKDTDEQFVFFDPYEERCKKTRQWLDEWEGNQDGFYVDGIKMINELDVVIAQNWLGYDEHAIEKIHPGVLKVNFEAPPRNPKRRSKRYPYRVMDTLVMSQLLNPERRVPFKAMALGKGNIGPHSIEAHGIRIGRYKPDNEDWTKLTDHMIHRCAEDVAIGDSMFDYLWEEWKEQKGKHPVSGRSIKDAYRMEAVMYHEMALQEMRGFRLDMNHAHKSLGVLDKLIAKILKYAMPHMPLKIKKAKYDHDKQRASAERSGWKHVLKAKVTHGSVRITNWAYVTQKGEYSANTKKDFPDCVGNIDDWIEPIVDGPYTPVVWEEVSLGNRDIVRQVLYSYGWRGVNLTASEEKYVEEHDKIPFKWAGKLDQASIEQWARKGKPPKWATEILKYYIYTHRRGQILNKGDMEYFEENGIFPMHKGHRRCRGLVGISVCSSSGKTVQQLLEIYGLKWFKKKQWDEDGEYRVPATAFAIGTNTFRMRHKGVVNIPSRGLFGKEMRQLFIASKGWSILGCDGSGLELRMLSHFMEDQEYEDVILHGDIHTHNQDKAGLPFRDMAKTFIYAFLYGSGIPGLAMTCGLSVKQMRKIVAQFLEELPLLKELIEAVQGAVSEKGFLRAVDGRWGRVRKTGKEYKLHTALNVLLQMTGSLCMKWGMYFARQELIARGVPCRFVANVHDEIQMEVKTDEVESKVYKISKSDWKEEEKNQLKRQDGTFWSAPKIIGETKKKFIIERKYHLAGDILMRAFTDAGTYLKIKTPLAGEYLIAQDWSGTH